MFFLGFKKKIFLGYPVIYMSAMFMNNFISVYVSPLNQGNNNYWVISFSFFLETGSQSNKWSSAKIRVGKFFI